MEMLNYKMKSKGIKDHKSTHDQSRREHPDQGFFSLNIHPIGNTNGANPNAKSLPLFVGLGVKVQCEMTHFYCPQDTILIVRSSNVPKTYQSAVSR